MKLALFAAVIALTGCEVRPAIQPLEFLTRQGCANTPVLKRNLDEALASLSRPGDYQVVDLDVLPVTDPRRAYPTPTVLLGGHDIFGLAQPSPPYPEPT